MIDLNTSVLWLVAALLLLVLFGQLLRSRLPWRWRWLWLPAILCLLLAMQPPAVRQGLPDLVLLTDGDADSEWLARQAAGDQPLLRVPSHPDWQQLAPLQQALHAQPAQRVRVFGHGLSDAAWQHLPPATVLWSGASSPVWQLHYRRTIALGDALTVQLRAPASAHTVQLRDSRDVIVIAQRITAGEATLHYPVASTGHFHWQLSIRDGNDQPLRTVPLPFAVQPVAPVRIEARFASPSFEQRALRDWWQQTGMQGEFFTQTGQQVTRRDRFNLDDSGRPASSQLQATPSAESVQLYDLRSWLALSVRDRERALARIAAGQSLLLLADGSENEDAVRRRLQQSLAMRWQWLPEPARRLLVTDVELQRSAWQPQASDGWLQGPDDGIWWRDWQRGRVLWLGVGDSHRLWLRDPQRYAAFWQQALQLLRPAAPRWRDPGPGIVGQPALLCLDDLSAGAIATADTAGENADGENSAAGGAHAPTLMLRSPSDQLLRLPLTAAAYPDRGCVRYTPTEAGWYHSSVDRMAQWHVAAAEAWPEWQWQAAQQATQAVSQATDLAPRYQHLPLPRWPFLLASMLLFSLMWWRERTQAS